MQEGGIESLMHEARWEDAVLACKAALQVMPASPKLNAYLGLCYFRMSEFAPAAESFRRAIELDPHFADAAIKYAQSLDRLQRYEEAYEVATEWIKVKPNDRVLQGLIFGLKDRVKGRSIDGWQRTQHLAHQVRFAQDDE